MLKIDNLIRRVSYFTVLTISIQALQLLTILYLKSEQSTIYYQMFCQKIAGWVINSVHPDETMQSGVSSGSTLLAQACLVKYVCKV